MSKIKRLAGETVLYGLGSIVPRFLNFLLVPLHTAVFDPEAYGVVTKLLAYVGVINTIYMFGMETAYFRFATKPGAEERKIFNLTQTAVLMISGALTILLIVLATPIASALEIEGREDLIVLLALIMFVDAGVAIPFARLRHQKKAMRFASAKLINVALLVGLNVYFLLFAKADNPDVGFIFQANLIANGFYILFFAGTLIAWRPVFERTFSPTIFLYAYPIVLTGLAGITNEMFSRMTLDAWLPPNFYEGNSNEAALGIFGAAYKLATLMALATQAFRYAAEPFFFSSATEKNSPQLFAKVNHYFVVTCCILLLAVSINLDIIKYFLAQPAYWQGVHVVPILLLSYLFSGVYYNTSIWFKLKDKTYFGTFLAVGGVLVTIVANYFLIPVAGYTGSSWAALISAFCMAAACYLLGQRFYPIPYLVAKDLTYVIVTTFIVYGVNSIFIPHPILNTVFHLVVITIYVVAVYLVERKDFSAKQA
jgi:O-antigen/teichoic acid export membrane protein